MRTKPVSAAVHAVFLCLLSFCTFGQEDLIREPAVAWQPSEFKSHETTWVRKDESGNIIGSFTEIQTGLNRQLEDGTWTRSSDEMEIVEGAALIRNAQFKAKFSASSDDPNGVFDIDLPGAAGRLLGHCAGLAYTASNGDSVFIGEIRAVQGLVVGRNEIIYPDCFTGGIKADLRYRVGNSVDGGRDGVQSLGGRGQLANSRAMRAIVSGNSFRLDPPFEISSNDLPSDVCEFFFVSDANVSGNTLQSGFTGLTYFENCTNSFILKNNFSGAAHAGILFSAKDGAMGYTIAAKNVINEGVRFHFWVDPTDAYKVFSATNVFRSYGTNTVAPVLEPLSLPIQISQ
jgi:hypothetical protein